MKDNNPTGIDSFTDNSEALLKLVKSAPPKLRLGFDSKIVDIYQAHVHADSCSICDELLYCGLKIRFEELQSAGVLEPHSALNIGTADIYNICTKFAKAHTPSSNPLDSISESKDPMLVAKLISICASSPFAVASMSELQGAIEPVKVILTLGAYFSSPAQVNEFIDYMYAELGTTTIYSISKSKYFAIYKD